METPDRFKTQPARSSRILQPPQAAARNAGLRLPLEPGGHCWHSGPARSPLFCQTSSAALPLSRREDDRGLITGRHRRPAVPPHPCPLAPASRGAADPARWGTEGCRLGARDGSRGGGSKALRGPLPLPFPKGTAEAGRTPRGCGRGKEPPAPALLSARSGPEPHDVLTRKRVELVP